MAPPRRGFKSDLSTGATGEGRFAAVVKAAGLPVEANPGESRADKAGYDLRVDIPPHEVRLDVEVKHDVSEAKTGNVAVETFNPRSGKPSGLSSTAAAVWVFVLKDNTVWAARVGDVRRAVGRASRDEGYVRRIAVAGDGNAEIHLFRRGPFFGATFFRLDDVSGDELAAILAALAA